jgi:hypothetical protein
MVPLPILMPSFVCSTKSFGEEPHRFYLLRGALLPLDEIDQIDRAARPSLLIRVYRQSLYAAPSPHPGPYLLCGALLPLDEVDQTDRVARPSLLIRVQFFVCSTQSFGKGPHPIYLLCGALLPLDEVDEVGRVARLQELALQLGLQVPSGPNHNEPDLVTPSDKPPSDVIRWYGGRCSLGESGEHRSMSLSEYSMASQWVLVHIVLHHNGCAAFVCSTRSLGVDHQRICLLLVRSGHGGESGQALLLPAGDPARVGPARLGLGRDGREGGNRGDGAGGSGGGDSRSHHADAFCKIPTAEPLAGVCGGERGRA